MTLFDGVKLWFSHDIYSAARAISVMAIFFVVIGIIYAFCNFMIWLEKKKKK